MLCLALGLGVLGAIGFARMHRRHHGWHGGGCHGGGCHGGGCHGGHGHHHGGWRHRRARRWMLGRMFERIDASPAQERALVAELDQLEQRLRTARGNLTALRPTLAEALHADTLDATAAAGLEAGVDAAIADARAALFDSLRAIHGLLDPKQRATLAAMLGGAARGAGPYRV
ncbi:MAG: Spy/CpxP family protein refolding chaperone [Myxococcales bacterium]|nr:Spy/CpxP family protein refolding chaperone [Myxococcales bacterium]MBK7198142.1 Spy/CpxP family protein refolding chaperone [Myxococcales bacterium]MBP6845680.1 Spy/CpxP family protein refolding chaperone [Kofleriaceae bacterium]